MGIDIKQCHIKWLVQSERSCNMTVLLFRDCGIGNVDIGNVSKARVKRQTFHVPDLMLMS
jgi:hypothetical protein